MLTRFNRSLLFNLQRCCSSKVEKTDALQAQLLAIDGVFRSELPQAFKRTPAPIFTRMINGVEYEDRIFGYNLKGVTKLMFHLLKIKAYFRYKSPSNRFIHLGSYIYEGDHHLTILWKLSSLKSNFVRYFPSIVTRRPVEYYEREGALEVHINPEYLVYKIINRPITDADRKAAEKFSTLQEISEAERDKLDEAASES